VIEQVVPRWHAFLESGGTAELAELLADDVIFYSPVVFTPQRGKDVTTTYLMAAKQVLGGEGPDGEFRYAKQVLAGDTAVLEFETSLGGKYVNGVDIIRCDDAGKIVEFRVMIRPLQAINALHAAMGEMLESLKG
jgi:ketosteroid isomerase-like protein